MPHVYADRVQMTTVTTGTGTITLDSATPGNRTFGSELSNADTTDILIIDGSAWEIARGCTYTTSGTTITRGTFVKSSTGSAINLSGSATVSIVSRAAITQAVYDRILNEATNTLLGRSTGGTGAAEEIPCTAAGRAILDDADAAAQRVTLGIGLPRSYLAGLTLSNNGSDANNDIDIAVGECRDSTHAADIVLASAITKRLDASWAVGSGNGGIDASSKANSTWYHVWLIKRSDTGVVDALFSTSASSPTMPTNYDYKRRIGSIYNNSSGNITPFTQFGDEFIWATVKTDVATTSPSTSGTLRTLSVPDGVKVVAKITIFMSSSSSTNTCRLYLSSPEQTDEAPSATILSGGLSVNTAVNQQMTMTAQCLTNTSSQIRTRNLAGSDANTTLNISTQGWTDTRGANG